MEFMNYNQLKRQQQNILQLANAAHTLNRRLA